VFELDPAAFTCFPTSKIRIHTAYFDEDLAARFVATGFKFLFISDVRSVDKNMKDGEKEARVRLDMERQMQWHNMLQPEASMVKFRLPYPGAPDTPAGSTDYLEGDIFFPVWGGRTTTECRLVVSKSHGGRIKNYCHRDYESLMYHFNTVTRTQYYEHDVNGEGLDHCFDCGSEILILQQYLTKYHPVQGERQRQLNARIALMSREISRHASRSGRTLALGA